MRYQLAPLLILVAACGNRASSDSDAPVLTEAAIAELPVITLEPGALMCTAIGADGCPLRGAVANRVDDRRIALWEPGFTVYLFEPNDTLGTPLGLSGPSGVYNYAVAITALGPDRFRLIVAGQPWRAIELNTAGDIRRVDTLPNPGMLTAIGYAGDRLVRQRMSGWQSDSGGVFTVTELDRLTDSTGRVLLEVPLPWLRGGNQNGPAVPPLISAAPAWALAPNGDIVWSPGDRLMVERRSPSGRVRWHLDGDAGPRVSAEDLDAREAAIRASADLLPYTEEHFAEMRARADTLHPAVTGLAVTPAGDVILARTLFPTRDSVDYLRISADGQPVGRFSLGRRARVLLAEGDSLLVHTPTAGEPWEVRWMRMQ
jgi:hypothetical protein